MHYIEVFLKDDSDDSVLEIGVDTLNKARAEGTLGSMIASLHGVKKYLTLKVMGQAGGQDVMVLINPRASHNFIDARFVERKNLKAKGFK